MFTLVFHDEIYKFADDILSRGHRNKINLIIAMVVFNVVVSVFWLATFAVNLFAKLFKKRG